MLHDDSDDENAKENWRRRETETILDKRLDSRLG